MIDSTVLIDVLQGHDQAKQFLISTEEPIKISRIVLMEIIAGSRNKLEMQKSIKVTKDLDLELVEINDEISQLAGELFERYFHQFGIGISDALIAASALVLREELVTHNLKHFRFISNLHLVRSY